MAGAAKKGGTANGKQQTGKQTGKTTRVGEPYDRVPKGKGKEKPVIRVN